MFMIPENLGKGNVFIVHLFIYYFISIFIIESLLCAKVLGFSEKLCFNRL